MRTVALIDTTIERSFLKEKKLSFKEKLAAIKIFDELKIDVIRLGVIGEEKENAVLVRTVSTTVKNSELCCTVDLGCEELPKAIAALSDAPKKRLLVSLPSSPALIEYKLGKKPASVLETLKSTLTEIKEKGFASEVRFVDATDAEEGFLFAAINVVKDCGVNKITVCDDAGSKLPEEFAAFVASVKERVKGSGISVNVSVSSPLGLALATSVAAVFTGGADGVEVCYGEDDRSPVYETINVLSSIGLKKGVGVNVVTTAAKRLINDLGNEIGEGKDKKTLNVALVDDRILTEGTSERELMAIITKLGYVISDEDVPKVYESFSRIMAKKGKVSVRELDAIIATSAMQVPSQYKVIDYIINTGNIIKTTASVTVDKNGESRYGLAVGDGPIDAAFRAIETITGHHYELDDFKIESVTEGKDAMGEAIVKLRHEGVVYVGAGISTDIVGASVRAYVSALNKIAYGEKK